MRLAHERGHGARVLQEVHHQRRALGLHLETGAAEPPYRHSVRFAHVASYSKRSFANIRSFAKLAGTMSPRHSNAAAAETRESIVREAVQRASREGLEALTMGPLPPTST